MSHVLDIPKVGVQIRNLDCRLFCIPEDAKKRYMPQSYRIVRFYVMNLSFGHDRMILIGQGRGLEHMTDYRQLAVIYLKHNKKRCLVTVMGVALCVVILFVIMNFRLSYRVHFKR